MKLPLFHINLFYVLFTVSIVTSQYYELETGEEYLEGPDVEEADVVNATQPSVRATAAPVTNGSTTPSPQHVMQQVHSIVNNVESLNITGIVDQALGIRNNTAVRNLVNSIMRAVFCNSFLAGYNNCGTPN